MKHSSKQLQKGRCGDTVEGYPEPALQQKTEEYRAYGVVVVHRIPSDWLITHCGHFTSKPWGQFISIQPVFFHHRRISNSIMNHSVRPVCTF